MKPPGFLVEIERRLSMQPYLELMYKALFCLAYYGMLRVGELTLGNHTVKANGIEVGDKLDKIMVILYTSKTHGQESRPQKIKIAAVPAKRLDTRFFCPIKAVIKYMKIRGDFVNKTDQVFIFSNGSVVKPYHFRSTLRALLEDLSLNSSLYDVHSFRIGRTCDLEKFGYSIEQIKVLGRWKSNAVYKYLKN